MRHRALGLRHIDVTLSGTALFGGHDLHVIAFEPVDDFGEHDRLSIEPGEAGCVWQPEPRRAAEHWNDPGVPGIGCVSDP
jgi:hypothetical protein